MHLNADLLRKLSDLFVNDLRASQYYLQLSAEDRYNLDLRLEKEAERGCRPLLPGALAEDIERTSEAAHDELQIELPTEIRGILAEVDGFSENGVSLYGSHQNSPDEATYGPTIVAENLSLWTTMPQTSGRYLFVGDSDHGYFAFELEAKQYVALARSTLEPIHCYASATEMVNDMLREALQIEQQDDLSAGSTASLEAELTRRRLGW